MPHPLFDASDGAAPTVFVIDDDPAQIRLVTAVLAGCDVRGYGSADDFLNDVTSGRLADAFSGCAGPSRAGGDGCAGGCVLLDVDLPGQLDGIDLHRRLAAAGVSLPVILLTGTADVNTAVSAMRRGAVDVIEKSFEAAALRDRVGEAVSQSKRRQAAARQRREALRRYADLTDREREVMRLVADGLANKQVAARLGISTRTVEVHRGRVNRKMAAESVADLVRLSDLVDPPADLSRAA